MYAHTRMCIGEQDEECMHTLVGGAQDEGCMYTLVGGQDVCTHQCVCWGRGNRMRDVCAHQLGGGRMKDVCTH